LEHARGGAGRPRRLLPRSPRRGRDPDRVPGAPGGRGQLHHAADERGRHVRSRLPRALRRGAAHRGGEIVGSATWIAAALALAAGASPPAHPWRAVWAGGTAVPAGPPMLPHRPFHRRRLTTSRPP